MFFRSYGCLQEAKERGDEFDTSEDTQTGIDMWFLSTPSWADGFKSSNSKKHMKGKAKTRMCLDWLNARYVLPSTAECLHIYHVCVLFTNLL